MSTDTRLDPRLRGTLQLLQTTPRAYRAFGWMWWAVKAAMKAQKVSPAELGLLGDETDDACVALASRTYGSADAVLDAALDHFKARALGGHYYAFDDHLPDGAAYRLMDEDAGYANL